MLCVSWINSQTSSRPILDLLTGLFPAGVCNHSWLTLTPSVQSSDYPPLWSKCKDDINDHLIQIGFLYCHQYLFETRCINVLYMFTTTGVISWEICMNGFKNWCLSFLNVLLWLHFCRYSREMSSHWCIFRPNSVKLARAGTCPCKVKEHTPGQVISLLKGGCRDRQHAFVSPKEEKIQSDTADVKVNHIATVFVVSKFSF